MKKIFFIAATAALALSSCSSDEELAQAQALNNGDVPVAFDSYMVRTTRAANTILTGMENITDGAGDPTMNSIKNVGFGVYAYEQGTEMIEDYTKKSIVPNFFNNEQVTFGTDWKYGDDGTTSGVKYWPNNPGAMLSFFAYAAYDNTLTHSPSENPCRLIYNGAYNGPAIQYTMPEKLKDAVDLCWGAEYGTGTSVNNPAKAPVNKPKPSVTDKVKFNFKHAMARYGFNVQVWSDEMTDKNDPNYSQHDPSGAANQAIKPGTTIKIKSVKLSGNFATSGILRLYDGKWDAQTALTGEYELKPNFGKKVLNGLTNNDAQKEIALLGDETHNNKNLYVMMIPGAKFQIVIEYDVITVDDKLEGGVSIVPNKITSKEVFTAEAGKAVDFHLNLGMTTVKFDAVVTDWSNDKLEEVDLPNNTLEVVSAFDYSTITPDAKPNNIDAMFIGEYQYKPADHVASKCYYNTTKEILYVSNATIWDPVPTTASYLANSVIYYWESPKVKKMQAPKWICTDGGTLYYQLIDGDYQPATNYTTTAYASVEALAQANPATGVYKVGTTIYYYRQQP